MWVCNSIVRSTFVQGEGEGDESRQTGEGVGAGAAGADSVSSEEEGVLVITGLPHDVWGQQMAGRCIAYKSLFPMDSILETGVAAAKQPYHEL